MLKSQRRTTGIGTLIAEAVLIMLSVVVGLMANEWRVAQENEKEAISALEFIREEIQSNYENIKLIVPYHEQISDSLSLLVHRVMMEGNAVNGLDMFRAMPDGFSTPLLSRNSWELANQTGAMSHVDLELAIALSTLYDQQAFYQKKIDIAGENIYVAGNIDTKDFSASVVAFGVLAADILIQERRLMNKYPTMITKLDSLIAPEGLE